MKKPILWVPALVLAGIFISISLHAQSSPKTHYLTIKKIKNEWKVVDSEDSTKIRVTAKRGEKIVWTAEGSDVYFQFMDENLFGRFKHELKDGKKLTLPIGQAAKLGPNPYAVFCIADKEYATGNSPPTIIIE